MSKKLFVGNLAWSLRKEDLEEAFGQFGELEDVFVMIDRATNRSKGFGFVTFVSEDDAATAQKEMHQKELAGRPISVDFARAKEEGRGDRF